MKIFKKQEKYVIEYDSIKKDQLNTNNDIQDIGDLSDGYHTYKELYEFRKVYNAALFNEWAENLETSSDFGQALFNVPKYNVHKSWRHSDGELCFGGGWFIVVAQIPAGQITNHYKVDCWSMFNVPETENALFEYDGHTAADTINRMAALLQEPHHE